MSVPSFENVQALQKELSPWLNTLGCHGIFLAEISPGHWGFRLHLDKLTPAIERQIAERLPDVPVEYREVPPPRVQT